MLTSFDHFHLLYVHSSDLNGQINFLFVDTLIVVCFVEMWTTERPQNNKEDNILLGSFLLLDLRMHIWSLDERIELTFKVHQYKSSSFNLAFSFNLTFLQAIHMKTLKIISRKLKRFTSMISHWIIINVVVINKCS